MDLTKFRLIFGHGIACAVENNKARTRCSLVNGTNKAILQVVTPSVFILQDGSFPVVGFMGVWFLVAGTRGELKVVGRVFGVPVDTFVVQIKRVAHLLWRDGWRVWGREGEGE